MLSGRRIGHGNERKDSGEPSKELVHRPSRNIRHAKGVWQVQLQANSLGKSASTVGSSAFSQRNFAWWMCKCTTS
jgi:hypothetical protein